MYSYFLRIIPLIAFLIILSIAFKRKNKIAMAIIAIYVVSSFSSLFINENDLWFHNFRSDNILAFTLYTIIHSFFLSLTLYIKPFSSYEQLPKGIIYNWMLVSLSIGALFSIIYLLPYALTTLARSAYEVRTTLSEEYVLPKSFLTTIAVGFPSFYYVYSFLFFVALIKRNVLNMVLSAFGVLAFVVNVLTVSGRDGVLLAGYSMLLGYFFFEPIIQPSLKKTIKKYFFIVLILGLIPIFKITVDRFSQTGELSFNAFKKGIINYLGMQPFIFSDWLKDNKLFHGGVNNFSFFVKGESVKYYEPYTWNFGTYLTSFYAINGYISLILVSLIFYLIFKYFLKEKNRYSIISLFFFYSFFLHYMISGVFYFRLGTPNGNIFMLLSIALVVFLKKIGNLKIY